MNFIARNSKKFRYLLAKNILKKLTPKLYLEIENHTFKNTPIRFVKDIYPNDIRPAIAFIKNRFRDNSSIVGLELGVKRGNNAYSILTHLSIAKLYLVDAWVNYHYVPKFANINYSFVKQRFKKNKKVKIIKGMSLEVVKEFNDKLDFIYIDSDHSYDAVYNDLVNWSDKVKENGIIAGHDIRLNDKYALDNPTGFNVYPALQDYCLDYGYVFYIQPPDWWFIKKRLKGVN